VVPLSELTAAATAIASADRLVVLTGAGISVESGVPAFRSPGGIWARYRPEELATPEAFRRDPRRVWEWYELRRRAVLDCEPNSGHRAIATLLSARARSVLLTQNVDGLHQRALPDDPSRSTVLASADPGTDPADRAPRARDRVVELHGNLLRSRCSECTHRHVEPDPDRPAPLDTAAIDTLPRCPECGGLLRPDVVWFGEPLPARAIEWGFEVAARADVCLVVGTSGVVHPAASLPLATREAGGWVIEVNPEATPLTRVARWSFRGTSGEVLPRLVVEF
jgi:NAD-dependent deacetylase